MNPSSSPRHRRTTAMGVLGALILAHAVVRLPAQPPPSGEVVSLPPLMVEEKGNPLVWRYLATPTQEIVSVCDDDTILAFAKRYHRLEELLEEIVPARFLARKSAPEANVIFNEKFGRARSQEVIAEMLQRSPGKAGPAGSRLTGQSGGQPRIRFLPNMRIADSDLIAVFSIFEDTAVAASRFVFAEERIAALLQDRVPRLPDWFVVGTVRLFHQTTFNDDEIAIGPAGWTSPEETAALKNDPGRPRALLPIEEMFAYRPTPAGSAPTETDRRWSAQCALFVRWAVAENKGARREIFWKWVDRLEKEPLTEATFRDCFGMGFSDARDRLSDYLPLAVNGHLSLKTPKSVPLRGLKVRLATDGEVARIRGGWERLEIAYVRKQFPAVVDKYIEQARKTLHRAYDRNDRDPRLLTELGLTEIEAGDAATAREFLEAAVQADTPRPSAYYQLALLRFNALPPGALKLTVAQSEEVLAPLLAGRRFDPPLLESYLLMSDVLRLRAEPPTPAQLTFLNQGTLLFAHLPSLVGRAVSFNFAAGQTATALELIDAGQRAAREPALHERYQRLREELTALKK